MITEEQLRAIADFEAIELSSEFKITPISEAGIKAMTKYRGVQTKCMLLPKSLFDGFQQFCTLRGANTIFIIPFEE